MCLLTTSIASLGGDFLHGQWRSDVSNLRMTGGVPETHRKGLTYSLMTTSAKRLTIATTKVTWIRLVCLPWSGYLLVDELAVVLTLLQCGQAIQHVTNQELPEALLCSKEQSIT